MQRPSRPTGVAILAILDIVVGILAVLGGSFLAAVGGSSMLTALGFSAFLSGLISFLGITAAFIGLFAILVGWGLWSGKSWAWTLAVVLYAVGAVLSLLSLAAGSVGSVVTLLLEALVLWYLWRPHVKAYYGKGIPASSMAPSSPPPPQ